MTTEEKIEEILRNQFVDKAYNQDGKTTWGIYETRDALLQLIAQVKAEQLREVGEMIDKMLFHYHAAALHGDYSEGLSDLHTELKAKEEEK
jgi:hypothetical protein